MEVVSLIIGALGMISGIGFGLYQIKEKRREQARADEAERVQARMADELALARRAQESLAAIEDADSRERQRAARSEARATNRHNSKIERETTAERKTAEKAVREQNKHQKKLEKEAAAHRKAAEKIAREARRKKK